MNDMELLQNAQHAICIGDFAPLQAIAHESLPPNAERIAKRLQDFMI